MISPETEIPDGSLALSHGPVRRLSIGAEPQPGGGVHFRLWAPQCEEVVVEIEDLAPAPMIPEPHGHFSCWVHAARAGVARAADG